MSLEKRALEELRKSVVDLKSQQTAAVDLSGVEERLANLEKVAEATLKWVKVIVNKVAP